MNDKPLKLVSVGTVGRPHGFRGEFVLSNRTGDTALPSGLTQVYLQSPNGPPMSRRLEKITPMPRGMRLKLEGFETEKNVRSCTGQLVLVERASLAKLGPQEFYVEDLVGCEARDTRDEKPIGRILGIEEVGRHCPDRWWIQTETSSFAVPATHAVIARVSVEERIVWLNDVRDYQNS